MYSVIVQLIFLVVISFAIAKVLKMKNKVNRTGPTFLQKYLACDSIKELLTPSFRGAYGIWFPEFLIFRNAFHFVWNGGRVMITFDPTTALLDMFTIGGDVAAKTIKDDTKKEVLLFHAISDKVKSSAQSLFEAVKKVASPTNESSATDASFQSKNTSVQTSTPVEEKCPVPAAAETVYKSSKEAAKDAEKVVVKVVMAAESKWTVFRFRVAKEFAFADLKNVVEERWAIENAKIGQWKLKYQDDEHEWITVQNQLEWEEAKRVHGNDLIRLHVA